MAIKKKYCETFTCQNVTDTGQNVKFGKNTSNLALFRIKCLAHFHPMEKSTSPGPISASHGVLESPGIAPQDIERATPDCHDKAPGGPSEDLHHFHLAP